MSDKVVKFIGFRERQSFSSVARNPLSQGIVPAFNMVCFTRFFSNATVGFLGENFFVSIPEITISVQFAIIFWYLFP